MREWKVGNLASDVPDHITDAIVGVMTTDSAVTGPGLTSTSPGGTIGFRGFSGNAWDYSAADHYPELRAFKFATAADWGTEERADLVKAYSLASTATAKLDTWDYALNRDTGKIDVSGPMAEETYDTVRDLTSSFTLTANRVDTWDRIGDQDSKTHGESKSVIAGETLDVLSLKDVGGQFICDELVPGIEWLMATCSVDGQTATRRLRVIPTASIDAGLNAVITGLYDHADDVKLFYSTGARIEIDRTDVTTGIYPDKEGESNAITAEQNKMLDNLMNTYTRTQTEAGNDRFYGADASYMGKAGENAADSELYVYIYKVTGIEDSTGEIKTGERITLTDPPNASSGAQQFNGYSLLDNTDQRYLIEYMWELKDGRVLSDAKMVRRARVPFNVTLRLYKNILSTATLYPTGGYLYTGVNAPDGSRLPLTDFSRITTVGLQAAEDAQEAEFKETAQTAWKLKDPAEQMISLRLTMQNGFRAIRNAEVFTKTIDNPVAGDTIKLPCVLYRIVYRNGGFYTIPEDVTRTYVLDYDTTNAVWHLEFRKSGEPSPQEPEILFNDVENNVFVDVVVRHAQEATLPLTVAKTLMGDTLPAASAFTFTLAQTGGTAANVTLPVPASITTAAIQSGSAAPVSFGNITFTAAGRYAFSVTETATGINGMRDAAPQTVFVKVTEANNTLAATVVASATDDTPLSNSLTFTNVYSLTNGKRADNYIVPQTGDHNPILIWGICMLIGLGGIITLTSSARRTKHR